MLILITPETNKIREVELINTMFHQGLRKLHLRKPNMNEASYRQYLEGVEEKYHHLIVIHEYHHLVHEYSVGGFHLKEQIRVKLKDNGIQDLKKTTPENRTVSSSFHTPESIHKASCDLDYYLLSPVFNSVSKNGYMGKMFNVKGSAQRVIGLGGISVENIEEASAMGYNGIAVLGSVWCSSDPLQAYQQISKEYAKYTW